MFLRTIRTMAAPILACTIAIASPALGGAQLAVPDGPVILTVSGRIGATNRGQTAQFDLEMLRNLPTTTFTTNTIWTNGPQKFTGVSLKDLFAAVDARGSTLKTTAINNYAVDLPATDAVEGGPILAYELNERPMSIRDKGPIWLIYPFDANPEYRTEVILSRCIWQLNLIDVAN